MTLTLSEDEVRVIADALGAYRFELYDGCFDDDMDNEDFEIAGVLLRQLGRDDCVTLPEEELDEIPSTDPKDDWADMDLPPTPEVDDDSEA